jgi:type I restriction enzyme S subunit
VSDEPELTHYPIDLDALPPGWLVGHVRDAVAEAQPGFASGAHGRDASALIHLRPMNVTTDGEISLEDVRSVDGSIDERRIRPGEVLFNNTNSPALVGKTALVRDGAPRAFSNHMTRLVANQITDAGFLAQQLRHLFLAGYFRQQCKKHVNQASIATSFLLQNVPFVAPPFDEQRRIVTKLDALRARSRRAKDALDAVPALLDRLRQSILAAAFRGDLTADWREQNPDVEPATELLQRIRVERRRRWDTGDVPGGTRGKYDAGVDGIVDDDLPDTWCAATWGQVGFSQNGRAYPSAEYRDDGVPLLRPGNLHVSGEVRWRADNTRCLPEVWARKHPGHVVGGGQIVMNLTAQSLKDEFLGRVCVTAPAGRCLLNQRIARLTPVVVRPRYMFWALKSPRFRRFVDDLNTGSLIQHMFTSQIDSFAFPLPPEREQDAIVRAIDAAMVRVSALASLVGSIAHSIEGLDSATLAAAFSGELLNRQAEAGRTV